MGIRAGIRYATKKERHTCTLLRIMSKKVYVEDVAPLIDKHRGNVTSVAKELGVSRRTVHRRINESVTLQEKLEQARQTMLDNAESVLYNAVLAGETSELIFFLKTQGKSRGYTEKVEQQHSGPGGGPIRHDHKVKVDEPSPEFIADVVEILSRVSADADPGGMEDGEPAGAERVHPAPADGEADGVS